jgi:hypothetical protein
LITKEQIVNHVIRMKNGNEKIPPQPEFARAALAHYNELFPEWNLNQAVKQAIETQPKGKTCVSN